MTTVLERIGQARAGSIVGGEESDARISDREVAQIIRDARDGTNGVATMTPAQVQEVFAAVSQRPGFEGLLAQYQRMRVVVDRSQAQSAAAPVQAPPQAQPARPVAPTTSPQRAATALPAAETAAPQAYTATAAATRAVPSNVSHLLTQAQHFNAAAWNNAHPNQYMLVDGQQMNGTQMRDFVTSHLQAAQTAAASGDWATVQRELAALGFPLPSTRDITLNERQGAFAVVMGLPNSNISFGTPPMSTMQGLSQHAALMADMARVGVSPLTDPPTLDQGRQYVDHVRRANPNDPQPVVEAAQRFAQGTSVHYRHHGVQGANLGHDIDYGANTNRISLRDGQGHVVRLQSGEPAMFDNERDARAYATANRIQSPRLMTVPTHTPRDEADVTTNRGEVDYRRESDCEGFAYIYSQVLGTQPGWENLGSIDVEPQMLDGSPRRPPHNIGHMFQIIRAPGGQVYLTSNDQAIAVRGTGANGAVTHDDIMAAANTEGYNIYTANPQPERLGMYVDTSSTNAVDTLRGAAERRTLRDDTVRFSTQPAVRPPPAPPLEADALNNAAGVLSLAWTGANGGPNARLWMAGHGTPALRMQNPLPQAAQAPLAALRAANDALQRARAESPPNPNALRDARVGFQAAALAFAQAGMVFNPPATGAVDAATAFTWLQSIAQPPTTQS